MNQSIYFRNSAPNQWCFKDSIPKTINGQNYSGLFHVGLNTDTALIRDQILLDIWWGKGIGPLKFIRKGSYNWELMFYHIQK